LSRTGAAINRQSIISRLGRGASVQVFSQIIQAVVRFAEIPIFISAWGVQLYGEWLMLVAVVTYLSMGDMGFVSAAGREMSMRSSAGNNEGALSVFQSTWVLLLFISFAAVSLAFCLADTPLLIDFLGFSSIRPDEGRILIMLLVLYVLIGFQGSLFVGGFWCAGRYPLGIFWSAIAQLLEFGGLVAALITGGGPVQAATYFMLGRLLGTTLTWISMHLTVPWLKFGISHASMGELNRLFIPALASSFFPIGNALNIQGLRLVVGVVLGPSMVVVFTPLRTLSRFAIQPLATINRVIEPELSMAFGKRDKTLFTDLFTHACQIGLWTGLSACLFLALISNWMFPLWTGGKIAINWPLYSMLLLSAALNAIWYTALMAPYATNRHERIGLFYCLVFGVFAVVAAYAGVKLLGLIGLGIALLTVEIIMAIFVIPASLKFVGLSWNAWFGVVIKPPTFLIHYFIAAIRRACS
jgi:O-antigen/teichoic acid export membrane protein